MCHRTKIPVHFYHFYVKYIGEVFLYIPISEKDFVACTWTIRKIVILYENVQALYLSGYTYIYVFTGYIVYVCSGYICIYRIYMYTVCIYTIQDIYVFTGYMNMYVQDIYVFTGYMYMYVQDIYVFTGYI